MLWKRRAMVLRSASATSTSSTPPSFYRPTYSHSFQTYKQPTYPSTLNAVFNTLTAYEFPLSERISVERLAAETAMKAVNGGNGGNPFGSAGLTHPNHHTPVCTPLNVHCGRLTSSKQDQNSTNHAIDLEPGA